MDRSLPGSSVHGISQARGLEWVPLPSPHSTATSIELGLGMLEPGFSPALLGLDPRLAASLDQGREDVWGSG